MRWFAVLMIALPLLAPGQSSKKGPDRNRQEVAVVEMRVKREEKVIVLEGLIRNDSSRALRNLTVFFEFLDADDNMVTKKNLQISDKPLEPGEEAPFEAQTPVIARAFSVRIDAQARGVQLTVSKAGPYLIE